MVRSFHYRFENAKILVGAFMYKTGLWRFSVGTRVTTDDGRPHTTPVHSTFARLQVLSTVHEIALSHGETAVRPTVALTP